MPKPYQNSDLQQLRQKSYSRKDFFRPGSKVGSSGANQALYGSYGHVTTEPTAEFATMKKYLNCNNFFQT